MKTKLMPKLMHKSASLAAMLFATVLVGASFAQAPATATKPAATAPAVAAPAAATTTAPAAKPALVVPAPAAVPAASSATAPAAAPAKAAAPVTAAPTAAPTAVAPAAAVTMQPAQTTASPAARAAASTAGRIQVTPGGVKYEDLIVGAGATAKAGQTVTVHYTGWLLEGSTLGRKFDSSKDRSEAFKFPLGGGRVIKGWDEGVAGMKVGGKRTLTIPPEMGYGARGAGTAIPPGATLVFEVELLGV